MVMTMSLGQGAGQFPEGRCRGGGGHIPYAPRGVCGQYGRAAGCAVRDPRCASGDARRAGTAPPCAGNQRRLFERPPGAPGDPRKLETPVTAVNPSPPRAEVRRSPIGCRNPSDVDPVSGGAADGFFRFAVGSEHTESEVIGWPRRSRRGWASTGTAPIGRSSA